METGYGGVIRLIEKGDICTACEPVDQPIEYTPRTERNNFRRDMVRPNANERERDMKRFLLAGAAALCVAAALSPAFAADKKTLAFVVNGASDFWKAAEA